MEHQGVISGPIRKRAELAGQIKAKQTPLRQMLIDRDSLDATLRIFQADIYVAEIRPKPLPPRHTALHGAMGRLAMDELRRAGAGLTIKALAIRVMAARQLNVADEGLVRTVQTRVGASLRHLRAQGIVRSDDDKAAPRYLRRHAHARSSSRAWRASSPWPPADLQNGP